MNTSAYRAIGQVLKNNPHPSDIVPCHRVISSDGKIGGYRGVMCGIDIEEKIALLISEGIKIKQ